MPFIYIDSKNIHFAWSIFKKMKKIFSARRGDRNGCVIFTVYNEREADFTHGNLKKIHHPVRGGVRITNYPFRDPRG